MTELPAGGELGVWAEFAFAQAVKCPDIHSQAAFGESRFQRIRNLQSTPQLGTYWTVWSGADGSIGGFVFYSLDQCFFDLFQAIGKGV